MSTHKLGETISHENRLLGFRDAHHVAGILCELATGENDAISVIPGTPVRFTGDSFTKVIPSSIGEAHGIVDPFLPPGTIITDSNIVLFWVLLKPGLTKNLQHNYEVLIDDAEEKGEWSCQGCD